jgi:hypothetical protein
MSDPLGMVDVKGGIEYAIDQRAVGVQEEGHRRV